MEVATSRRNVLVIVDPEDCIIDMTPQYEDVDVNELDDSVQNRELEGASLLTLGDAVTSFLPSNGPFAVGRCKGNEYNFKRV